MKIEVMIYLYGAVCVCMIVFNIVYSLILRGSQPRMQRRCRRVQAMIEDQLDQIQTRGKIQPDHLKALCGRLSRVNNLIAFYHVVNEDLSGPSALLEHYLHQIRPAILSLALIYMNKEDSKASYFTYFLFRYAVGWNFPVDSLQDVLLDYVRKQNLYCRVNALKALYRLGNPDHVINALKIADDGAVFLHEKLVTEGLLSYAGDHASLIARLWAQFESFSPHMQLAVLNYIRFCSGNSRREMYAIMQDSNAQKELRIAAIRYFGKYAYEPAKQPLLAFVLDTDAANWEFATVAASSLAAYPCPEVLAALKEALHSANWYVRYSAAQSLDHLHVDYSDIIDVAMGNDRYAREMIMYRLEARHLTDMEGGEG